MDYVSQITGRNAAQRGFILLVVLVLTGFQKVSPAVLLSPVVSFCTRVSAGMKPLIIMGGDSSGKMG